ncbi:MAG: extracellular solute-binding protein [Anaerolineae bacterium]|jgi:sn-glycerol 3-phosphate transport system substrate-binding protein|nr:extracellular solute-binding protein [Anaerolineae bacterium]
MIRKSFAALLLLMLAMVALAPVSAQATEVKMWIAFTDNRLDWTQDKAAKFNELFPQYNVVVEGYPNYEQLFAATALAAGNDALPSVVQYFEVATRNALDSGYFKPLADAIGDRTEINGVAVALDDIIAPTTNYYTIDGRWSSMPWNTSSSIMFSNMSILEAAGVAAPPATWAEVEVACEAIMALDNAPEFCFTWPNHGWFFEQWMAQQNQTFANNSNGRDARADVVEVNTPAALALLTWLKDMQTKGYLYYSGARDGSSWGTVDQAFQSQQVAMAVYSSSDTAIYTETGAANGYEVRASFLPYNQAAEGGWTGNLIGGASLWLVDGLAPEVEEGALTWLLWLNNTENAAEWHQITGYLPIRNSSVELLNSTGWFEAIAPNASEVWTASALVQAAQGQNWFEANPNFIIASEQLAGSQATPATQGAILGNFPAIRSIVTQAVDTVLLTDGADIAAILGEAQTNASATLDQYNSLVARALGQ